MNQRFIAVVLGAAALAVPAAAAADSGHGRGHVKPNSTNVAKDHAKRKKAKPVMFVFKGSFTAPGTVVVRSGNAHVRKGGFVDHAVTFDLTSARVVVTDTNADTVLNLADVKDGDLVLVQARMARGTKYDAPTDAESAEPLVARRLIDKTNTPIETDDPADPGTR
jgi:hypothetical protein